MSIDNIKRKLTFDEIYDLGVKVEDKIVHILRVLFKELHLDKAGIKREIKIANEGEVLFETDKERERYLSKKDQELKRVKDRIDFLDSIKSRFSGYSSDKARSIIEDVFFDKKVYYIGDYKKSSHKMKIISYPEGNCRETGRNLKIQVIKKVRENINAGLKEAKEVVEEGLWIYGENDNLWDFSISLKDLFCTTVIIDKNENYSGKKGNIFND